MFKTYWFSTVFVLSLFLSCRNDLGPLADAEGDYSFFTIDEGTLLSSGSDIQVRFSGDDSHSDRIVIRLKNDESDEVAVVEVLPDDLKGEGLPVALPDDLAEGLYLLSLEVWENDMLLSEREVYFYVVDGAYSVDGIETYPPNIQAGGSINARAYLSFPKDRDPWLRWSLDDQVLKEGFLSDAGVTCFFSVPEEEGVFSLKAELFPVKPELGHHSSAVSHSDLFVTTAEGDSWSLLDDKVYTFYVSFESGPEDAMGSPGSPKVIGNPKRGGRNTKGYAFSSEDGLRYSYNTLPLDARGTVQNFTLSMDFDYTELPSSGQWGMISIGSKNSHFLVYYNGSDDTFYAGFSGTEDSFSSLPSDVLPNRGRVSLDLMYTSEGGNSEILWFAQNEMLHKSSVKDLVLPGNGVTLVGSDLTSPGLPLLWLNLGISKSRDHLGQNQTSQGSPANTTPETVYSRGASVPGAITVSKSSLSAGLYTLELSLDDAVVSGSWQFSLMDSNSGTYYTFDSFFQEDFVSQNKKMNYPEVLAVSFINNNDGFFLSHSSTTVGPFPYQESLNFQIVPYNNDESGLDAIKEIRLYQD